jgi:hypothetical protein
MRHSWSISDSPDLPIQAFRKALFKNRPATLEGGKGGAPSAPDPYVAAGAQGQLNTNTALYNKALNLGNYNNPFGSQASTITGYDPQSGAPIYTTNISANPQLQGLLNQQLGAVDAGSLGRLNDYLGNIGMQSQGIAGQYGALANQAAYQAQSQYLDPQYAQQEESLGAKLAAQGLAPGSQAYNNAMLNFQNEKQRAYSNAANQSILTGSQLGSQNLQNQISSLGAQGSLLGGQLGALGNDMNSIQQRAGLVSQGYGNLQNIASLIPGYTGTGQSAMNPADITSAMNNQYQGQLGAYNARQQSSNANTAALAGLAGTAAMMFF